MTTYKPTVSVVLPTIGRPFLEDAIEHIVGAGLTSKDEIIVLVDGENQYETDQRVAAMGLQKKFLIRTFMMADKGGYWGHPGRNRGQMLATKQAVMFTQDDQLLVPGSLVVVKECLLNHEDWESTGHLFQVVPRAGNLCFFEPGETRCGHIDADCVVLPRSKWFKFGKWQNDYNGDHDFIMQTMGNFGKPFAYHSCLISINRDHAHRYPEMFP